MKFEQNRRQKFFWHRRVPPLNFSELWGLIPSKYPIGDPECFKLRSSGLWGYFVKCISGLMMKLLASCSAIYTGYHHEISISKGKVSPNPSEFWFGQPTEGNPTFDFKNWYPLVKIRANIENGTTQKSKLSKFNLTR